MKLKKLSYWNIIMLATFICFAVSLVMLVRAYQYKKSIDEIVDRQEQLSLYRQRLSDELEQVNLDYAASSQRIIQYVKTHTKVATIDYNKIYTEEELDQLRVSLYVEKNWGEIEEWDVLRCNMEVDMLLASYGYILQSQEEFECLLLERESLYQVKIKLQEELNHTYQEGFSLE